MRRLRARLLALAAVAAIAGLALAQQPNLQVKLGRSVHGTVLDGQNRPLASAIVYLKDQRTKVIHTAITDGQGGYSFHQLQPNVGYEVYAVWKKQRSPVRTLSEYETEADVRLDLKVPVG